MNIDDDLKSAYEDGYEKGFADGFEAGQRDVQPERKKGKWIRLDKGNTFFVPHMLQCSECGNTLDKHGVNAGRGDANYCPNCGARMRGEEHG